MVFAWLISIGFSVIVLRPGTYQAPEARSLRKYLIDNDDEQFALIVGDTYVQSFEDNRLSFNKKGTWLEFAFFALFAEGFLMGALLVNSW